MTFKLYRELIPQNTVAADVSPRTSLCSNECADSRRRLRRSGLSAGFARKFAVKFLTACCLGFLLLRALCAATPGLSDAELTRISFDQRLNAQVPLDLQFADEDGRAVRLGEYFAHKPVILVLGYYQCPMLCTLVVNGMVESLEDLKWSIGREFDVVHVSIDPRETPPLAAAKKRNYLKRYGRTGAAAGWHFLTGDSPAIQQLAAQVGFEYAYDAPSHQYAHASGLIILTPQGKVAHYLFGVTFTPADLYQSLADASTHKIGSPIQRLILLCFHYNPITGKYGATIMLVIRILSVLTILGLAALILSQRSAKLAAECQVRSADIPVRGCGGLSSSPSVSASGVPSPAESASSIGAPAGGPQP